MGLRFGNLVVIEAAFDIMPRGRGGWPGCFAALGRQGSFQ